MGEFIALAGCGGVKAAERCRADQMYTGPYARKCWAAALSLCPDAAFWISARHGILPPDTIISPYDLRMGQPGSVTAAVVQAQAADLGIADAAVVVLAGRAYADLCREVWADVRTPLAGLFIGQQLHELAVIAARGRLLPAAAADVPNPPHPLASLIFAEAADRRPGARPQADDHRGDQPGDSQHRVGRQRPAGRGDDDRGGDDQDHGTDGTPRSRP